jgi:hypothetical protein
VNVDACSVACHLGERGGEASRTAVLQRLDEPAFDELERRFDQLLAGEGVADLHGGPLVRIVLAELRTREYRRAADPVPSGRGAVEHDVRADRGRARARNPVRTNEADAHRVDEAVVSIGLVEDRFAADGRYAARVSVMPDAGDRSAEVVVGFRKTQSVENRDRPRTHGDDVAQDPADARGRSLERLDRRGVVVRLDLEGDGLVLAEVDHAGVLTGALQDTFSLGGKAPQQEGRVLVAAMLRPEQGKDGELEIVRVAAEQLADAVELPVGQPQRAVERLFRRDLRQGSESTRGRRRAPATFPLL